VAELHEMRVVAKRLRYTLEIFAPLYPDRYEALITVVKEMQELLGGIHDADVWIDFLPRFTEEERIRTRQYYNTTRPMARLMPGIAYLRDTHQKERERLYKEFLRSWDHWTQDELTWEKLDEIIARPLSIKDPLFPPSVKGDGTAWIT
jgi:CHAD domain-containing protein